jgi:uncharacterized membrane protein
MLDDWYGSVSMRDFWEERLELLRIYMVIGMLFSHVCEPTLYADSIGTCPLL